MNKNIMLLAAGAMLLMGGCSKSEIDEGSLNATNAISFEASSNKATKASAVTNANVEDYKFGVFAYYTKDVKWASFQPGNEPNFMNNEEVHYDDTYGWIYEPVKYWPNTTGEMISFFGYLPFSDATTATIGTNGVPVIEFKQTMTAENMEDLTVAKALDKTKTTGAVSLPFKHVLSRLNFAARVDHDLVEDDGTDAQTQVFIKGLRILGTEVNMKVENPNDVVAANAASMFYNAASYTMSADADDNGSWDYTTTPTQQGEALEATSLLAAVDQTVTDTNYSSKSVVIASNGDATSLLTAGQYLFLIPPSENGVENESDVVLQVDYDVVTKDGSLTDSDKHFTSSSTATLSMPNGSIKEGVAYNVVMTIGLNEVKLAANSTLWDTEEDAYTVVAGEAQSAEEIATKIQTALNGGKDAVIAYNQATAEPLDIDFLDLTNESTKSITINLLHQTGPVSITTKDCYKGNITINAPNATVTIDGGTYYNPTAATAPTTLVIAKDAIVDGLTIAKGNVVVYGVLNGEVVRSMDNTDTTTTITFMLDSTNGITKDSADDDITINEVPTAAGLYYSLDCGAWTTWSSTDITELDTATTYRSIKVMTIGESTLSYNNVKELATYDFINIDLGDCAYCKASLDVVFDLANTALNVNNLDRQLETFALPYNVTATNAYMFRSCSKLKSVTLPDCFNDISLGMFRYCSSLTDVNINPNTRMGAFAFQDCVSLKDIAIENIIEFYGYYNDATFVYSQSNFNGCTSLGPIVTLNETITDLSLTSDIFRGCTGIEEIVLPPSLKKLGGTICPGCTNLEKMDLPSTLTEIGTDLFNGTAISSCTWPAGLTTIPARTFKYCTNLTEFTIPDNITEIGGEALRYSSITGPLTVPSSVETFSGVVALGYMDNVKEIIFEDNSNPLTFPLGTFANPYLEKITLPKNVVKLQGRNFRYCLNLHTIICKTPTVPITSSDYEFGAVENTQYDGVTYTGLNVPAGTKKVLYVPQGSRDDYMAETITVNGESQENYWKTVLVDECHFEVIELDENGDIPTLE